MKLRISILSFGIRRLLLLACGFALLASALPAQEKNLIVDLGGGAKMEFVLIPAGSFLMGSNEGRPEERPTHKVKITKPFYMGKYEVTQEQWQVLMGEDSSTFERPKNPVSISWDDCINFLSKLQAKVSGMKASLPTEAQWEYACRAGGKGKYHYGNDEAELGFYAWFYANSEDTMHPAGEKKPNAWGLYDMYGNLWEWCADWYGESYYNYSPKQDPKGPDLGEFRVMRGGSFGNKADVCRSATRAFHYPTQRICGFRAVLEIQ
ncbi:MAG: formylglycine-generating enzyme family protein [Candidatus Aminicenantales bacterium]